jgi:hypothetical protein
MTRIPSGLETFFGLVWFPEVIFQTNQSEFFGNILDIVPNWFPAKVVRKIAFKMHLLFAM